MSHPREAARTDPPQSVTHYIDGQFVLDSDALIPATDLAVLRGYGVFDYFRTYGGRPFHLEAHLARLQRSAGLIGLEMPHSLEEIRPIVMETLRRNSHAESNVRVILTGGDSDDHLMPRGQSRLIILVTPFVPPPETWYRDGVKVITERTERYMPEAKTLNYTPAIVALQKAKIVGAIDAIYIDRAGRVLEGTTTNLFAFVDDVLVTPGDGILCGITREVVLELASDLYEIQIRDLSAEELLRADEVFITSSNKQICPVRQIDDTVIGSPGRHTQRLMEHFKEFVLSHA
jgi:branched-chain amino acid aminotransferase